MLLFFIDQIKKNTYTSSERVSATGLHRAPAWNEERGQASKPSFSTGNVLIGPWLQLILTYSWK